MATSGYTPCACRDCMEIAIGDDGALCTECREAGCYIWPGEEAARSERPGYFECKRLDAYASEEEA